MAGFEDGPGGGSGGRDWLWAGGQGGQARWKSISAGSAWGSRQHPNGKARHSCRPIPLSFQDHSLAGGSFLHLTSKLSPAF